MGGSGNDPWADGSLAIRLRKLWLEKNEDGNPISTAAIGRQLGVSKNAVVGKAHRLDLPARPSPILRNGRPKPLPSRPNGKAPKTTLPSLAGNTAFPQSTIHVPTRKPGITVVTRASRRPSTPPVAPAPRPYGRVITCCWPIGEPRSKAFRFCDAPSEPGKPYCPDHVKLGSVRIRDRREDDAA